MWASGEPGAPLAQTETLVCRMTLQEQTDRALSQEKDHNHIKNIIYVERKCSIHIGQNHLMRLLFTLGSLHRNGILTAQDKSTTLPQEAKLKVQPHSVCTENSGLDPFLFL